MNAKRHSAEQVAAARAMISSVGWLTEILVNKKTGRILDGHLRVEIAISIGEPTVPVRYIEVGDEREASIIAAFDTSTRMASWDKEKAESLLESLLDRDLSFSGLAKTLAECASIELDSILSSSPGQLSIASESVPISEQAPDEVLGAGEDSDSKPKPSSEEEIVEGVAKEDVRRISLGPVSFEVPAEDFHSWRKSIRGLVGAVKSNAIKEVLKRLEIPEDALV